MKGHNPAKLIAQGAEAKIYLSNNTIQKTRVPKSYRHPKLDNTLRTRRTKAETKILNRAFQSNINVPKTIHTDKFNIQLELINGEKLSQTLNQKPLEQQISIIKKLATQIKKLHEANIIHSDLTTSNTILLGSKVYLIDFGLSYISTKTEDKAVDLHLLQRALQAKHYQNATILFNTLLKAYNNPEINQKLKIVEKRGRYKH